MTTIAFDGIRVAADSRACLSEIIVQTAHEKLRRSGGWIYATTGYGGFLTPWIRWHNGGKPLAEDFPADRGCDTNFLAFDCSTGLCHFYCGDVPHPVELKAPIAFGSGRDLALGSMLRDLDVGRAMDAVAAVNVAIKGDPHSGAPVQVLELKQKGRVLDLVDASRTQSANNAGMSGYFGHAGFIRNWFGY